VRFDVGSTEVGVLAQGLSNGSDVVSTNNSGTEGKSQNSSDEVEESIGNSEAAVFAALDEETKDRENQSADSTENAKNTKSSIRVNSPFDLVTSYLRLEGSSSNRQVTVHTENDGKEEKYERADVYVVSAACLGFILEAISFII
jgi:hypothetical protein